MEENNRELLNTPKWFGLYLDGYRSTNKRYSDIWSFFGVSLNHIYAETKETKNAEGTEVIYKDITSEYYSELLHKPIMQDYSKGLNEVRTDVKYGWDDVEIRQRLKKKKKLLKKQLEVVRRTNKTKDRESLRKLSNLFAYDIFGYGYNKKDKPSMLRIMIDMYIELELARDKAKKEVQALTDPLFLQRRDIRWFVQREYERYVTLTTEIKTYESEMAKWERVIALLYYPLYYCSLTDKYEYRNGFKGRKPEFLSNRKGLDAFYDTEILTGHETPTHWDWIKAVLRGVDSIVGDANYKYDNMVRDFVNHNFNGSTNMSSNFYRGVDNGASIFVLEGLCKLYKLNKQSINSSSKGLCLAYAFNKEYKTDVWFRNAKMEGGSNE